jgi:hypothetical protein
MGGTRATFALVGGDVADSHGAERNGGRFAWSGGNETELDSYVDDPCLARIGSTIRVNGGGGGGRCYDDLPSGPGGRRVQMFLEHVEQSEMSRGDTDSKQTSLKWMLNDGGGEADANMVAVFQLETRTGLSTRPGHEGELIEAFQLGEPQWESLVRQLMARLGGHVASAPALAGGFPNKLVSPDGLVELDIQNADALNMTYYERATPDGPGVALWSLRDYLVNPAGGGFTAAGRARFLR